MFLKTLGLKTDGMITSYLNVKLDILKGPKGLLADGRGKHECKAKSDEESMKQHIESFHPQISHYNREHAPNRRYLDPTLNVTSMWKDYCEKHQSVSHELHF